MTYVVLVGGLMLLLMTGMPVGAALLMLTILMTYFFLGGTDALLQVALSAYKALNKYVLIALPLYILMGEVFIAGRTSKKLFDVASSWLRHVRAGIGLAVTASCGFFAAISGSSMTTAATIGRIAIPEMRARGYSKSLSYGLVAGGGSLGIMIPPSLAMILYSALTDESVGKLFLAGVFPGLLEMALTRSSCSSLPARNCPRSSLRPGGNGLPTCGRPVGRSCCPWWSWAGSIPAG